MTKERAIGYLGMAVPLTALTVERFAEFGEAIRMAVQALEAEPKTGTWIHCGWAIACSECNYDMPWAVRNYCPNCGARMKDEGR